MYDTYTILVFLADESISQCEFYFDDDATLSELGEAIRDRLAYLESWGGEIIEYRLYKGGDIENFADLEPIAIDIC